MSTPTPYENVDITLPEFTEAILDGSGVFDVLMRSTKAHLEEEYQKNRIKGAEYATVYLGAMQYVMQTSLELLLQKRRAALEAALLEEKIITEKKQQCKLDAEFDLLQANVLKAAAESELLAQKLATERAQISTMGVDTDSVIGRQKALYHAQTDGFKRDAEQKAAKILADSWGVRRSTDEGEQANATNMLDNATIGRAINKLLSGVGA